MFLKPAQSFIPILLATIAIATATTKKFISHKEVYNSLSDMSDHWDIDISEEWPSASAIDLRLSPLDDTSLNTVVWGFVNGPTPQTYYVLDLLLGTPPFCGIKNAVITFTYYMENGSSEPNDSYIYPIHGFPNLHFPLQNSTSIEWTTQTVAISDYENIVQIFNIFQDSGGLFLWNQIIFDYIVEEGLQYPCANH